PQGEAGLVARVEPAASQTLSVPTEFAQRSGQYGQCAQRPTMIVEFSGVAGNPTDQPDVEFVITEDAGEPTLALGHSAFGQQMVAASAEHVVGGLVGGVQQVRHPQPSG